MKFEQDLSAEKSEELFIISLNLAISHFEELKYDDAIKRLKFCLKIKKTSKLYRIYSKCEKMKENYQEALEMINKAIELEPNNELNQIELKSIKMKIKKHDEKEKPRYNKMINKIYSNDEKSLYEDVKPKKVLYGSDGSELYY